jgi:PBP1b-binding outer membrane lipoprotein LpoB
VKYSILALCLLLLLTLASCIRLEDEPKDPVSDTQGMTESEPEPVTEPDTRAEEDTQPEEDTLPNEADPDHTKRY